MSEALLLIEMSPMEVSTLAVLVSIMTASITAMCGPFHPSDSGVFRMVRVLTTVLISAVILYVFAFILAVIDSVWLSITIVYDRVLRRRDADRMVDHFSVSTYIMERITLFAGAPAIVLATLVRRAHLIVIPLFITLAMPINCNVFEVCGLAPASPITHVPAEVFKCVIGVNFSASTIHRSSVLQSCKPTYGPLPLHVRMIHVDTPSVNGVQSNVHVTYAGSNASDIIVHVSVRTSGIWLPSVGVLGLENSLIMRFIHHVDALKCQIVGKSILGNLLNSDDMSLVLLVTQRSVYDCADAFSVSLSYMGYTPRSPTLSCDPTNHQCHILLDTHYPKPIKLIDPLIVDSHVQCDGLCVFGHGSVVLGNVSLVGNVCECHPLTTPPSVSFGPFPISISEYVSLVCDDVRLTGNMFVAVPWRRWTAGMTDGYRKALPLREAVGDSPCPVLRANGSDVSFVRSDVGVRSRLSTLYYSDSPVQFTVDIYDLFYYYGVIEPDVYEDLDSSALVSFEDVHVSPVTPLIDGRSKCAMLDVVYCVVEDVNPYDYTDDLDTVYTAIAISCLVAFTSVLGVPGMAMVRVVIISALLVFAVPSVSSASTGKPRVVVLRKRVAPVTVATSPSQLHRSSPSPPQFHHVFDVTYMWSFKTVTYGYVNCSHATVIGQPSALLYGALISPYHTVTSMCPTRDETVRRCNYGNHATRGVAHVAPPVIDYVVEKVTPSINATLNHSEVHVDEPRGDDEQSIDIGEVVVSWLKAMWSGTVSDRVRRVVGLVQRHVPLPSVYIKFSDVFDVVKYYAIPTYTWEVASDNLSNLIACLKVSRECKLKLVHVTFAPYWFNLMYIFLAYVLSICIASVYINFKFKSGVVLVFGHEIRRVVYNTMLMISIVLFCLSVDVRVSDYIIVLLLAALSGAWYVVTIIDNTDSCFKAPVALPFGLWWFACNFVHVTVLLLRNVLHRFRMFVIAIVILVTYILNRIDSDWFIEHGKTLSRGSNVPVLWVVLSIISSICTQLCVIAIAAPNNPLFVLLLGIYACVAGAWALILFMPFTVLCVALGSKTLWDPLFQYSIPRLLLTSGYSSRVIVFHTFSPEVVSRSLMLVMLMHLCHIVCTQANAKIFQLLTYGFTPENVSIVFQRKRTWRLMLARKFIPRRAYRNVYWLTATTGAGKTTVDSHSRYVLDDGMVAGIGFNVIDVDACILTTGGSTRHGIAEARLAAASGSISDFLATWVPVAQKYVDAQLKTIASDPPRARLPTLVMVHVPDEGTRMGFPICNFLGHVHVTPEEAAIVAASRAQSVAPDVTKAFIMSDNMANAHVTKIDWTDVQELLGPIVAIKDVPLAIFPDLGTERVYVKVDVRAVTAVMDDQVQVHGSVGPIPLVAIVRQSLVLTRWGQSFVRAEEFGDTQRTVLDAAKSRKYYDDIPLTKDGHVDRRKLEELFNCVVYRLELPARHGSRGVSSAIRMRMDIMSSHDRDKAAALIHRKYASHLVTPSTNGSTVVGSSAGVTPIPFDLSGMSGSVPFSGDSGFGSSSAAFQQHQQQQQQHHLQQQQQQVEAILNREMKAVGTAGTALAPPIAQFQSSAPGAKIKVQGYEFDDDDSMVRASRNILPPTPPSRSTAMRPCPSEVAKVVEVDAALTPSTPIEALRRYVPPRLAGKVDSLVRHGDAPSAAKHPRQMRGWAIKFTDDAAKLDFFQNLRDGVIGTELVADPFVGAKWKEHHMNDSADSVQKFKKEMLQGN